MESHDEERDEEDEEGEKGKRKGRLIFPITFSEGRRYFGAFFLSAAPPQAQTGPAAELVLAADQFLITPVGRVEDAARMRASGDEIRTVIAGYHWFTDWGRDTMISLEGLTLMTGRKNEAGWILRTFAHYVRDGLIPNMFPEGKKDGLYHTADATLWFFHAIHRYVEMTGCAAAPGAAGISAHQYVLKEAGAKS